MQKRSQETLERLFDAAERLLDRRDFELISITDLCREANVAIGTFYTRFKTKNDLLPRLYERYERDLAKSSRKALDPERWSGLDLAATVGCFVEDVVGLYRSHRGLWRAIQLRNYSRPHELGEGERARRAAMLKAAVQIILRHRNEIRHPQPKLGVEFALTIVMATCKEKILFAEATRGMSRNMSDRMLTRELTRCVLGLLDRGQH